MKIQVINAYEPKLQSVLPKGHSIEIESPVTLLVGENNTGKTAFLKLLYSSLVNSHFFDYGNISRLFREVRDEISRTEQGYQRNADRIRKLIPDYKGKITKNGLEEYLKEDTDHNRFVFFKPKNGQLVFPFCDFVPVELANAIDQDYDATYKDPHRFSLEEDSHDTTPGIGSRRSFDELLKRVQDFYEERFPLVELKYTTFDSTGKRESRTEYRLGEPGYKDGQTWRDVSRVQVGSGSYPSYEERVNWTTIVNIISRKGNHRRNPLARLLSEMCTDKKNKYAMGHIYYEKDIIPDNAEAVILLDEPTSFMSYANRRDVRDALSSFLTKYNGARALIATNDAALIEHAESLGWGFLDFGIQPVRYVHTFRELSFNQ